MKNPIIVQKQRLLLKYSNGKIKEEIQIIDGSHEEVMKKVEQITADSNINKRL